MLVRLQSHLVDKRANLDPYAGKRRLTFRPDGTFKITIFSDLHFGENPWEWWGPEHDASSVNLIKTILGPGGEDADFAVINGDLITGENTFASNSTRLVDQIVQPIIDANIPFATTQGNHDNQPNINHQKIIDRERSLTALSYTRTAPAGVGGEGGPGNYWVPVYKNKFDKAPVLILWFFDSRGGFSADVDHHGIPDHVDAKGAGWIESETEPMNATRGPADQRGAVAFVHIPPNVVRNLPVDPETNPSLNDDILGDGSNLHAIISGHDHGNEWCVREPSKGVIFCFDKHSGPFLTALGPVATFTSPDPKAGVKTWIRLENGETRAAITLDKRYKRSFSD
ncbi:Metallo-dependent phosphatase-like protein [Lyophyllum atratum]|nr:Metallo-dependent phosphatase-like protein [Lyophyllum atratum]